MIRSAPRSIDQYLQALREELAGEDTALIQDALYDAEEYLRAEVATHPDKSEADVLELIASTYGAPDEVAAAYRDTEARVKAAMTTPRRIPSSGAGAFFGVFLDPRAYTCLFFMLLSLATGIIYFTFAVTGLALSAGFAVLVIGIPFFLLFMGLTRVVSLAEGRLIEAMTGERMPRRPVHQNTAAGFWSRVGRMLKDRRTWTTLAYLILMLPLGVVYFVVAVTGLSLSLACIFAPLLALAGHHGWFGLPDEVLSPVWLDSAWGLPMLVLVGVLLLTVLMHLARGIGRLHAAYAKALLVAPTAAQ
ncbi:MAG TPA: sensor domain-containing protein [Steroidobacteraceae bacterium]|nr:sensor domain-containing protein [Steroidobacteraceae bacterium]